MRRTGPLWLHVGLAVCATALPARADLLQSEMTSERVIQVPLPFAAGQQTLGAARATAAADAAAASLNLKQSKLIPIGDPRDPVLQTPPVGVNILPVLQSPTVPGTTATASARISLDGTMRGTNGLRITSTQRVAIGLSTGAGTTAARAHARTRDPITVGEDGFGDAPLPGATTLSMDFSLVSVGLIDPGSMYSTESVVVPANISDPDLLFDTPPAGTDMLFSLVVDFTGPTKDVTFTPGTADSLSPYDFAFSAGPGAIETIVETFVNGGADPFLFNVTVKIKDTMTVPNLTFGNQDELQGSLAVPEPSSLILGLCGVAVTAAALRRRRTR